jgi:hypothetical protein
VPGVFIGGKDLNYYTRNILFKQILEILLGDDDLYTEYFTKKNRKEITWLLAVVGKLTGIRR